MTATVHLIATAPKAPHRFPRSDGTQRPYRLWDANARKPMPWRYYLHKRNAHLGAYCECRWAKVGTTIEVYDARNGRLIGQYTRRIDAVRFTDTGGKP